MGMKEMLMARAAASNITTEQEETEAAAREARVLGLTVPTEATTMEYIPEVRQAGPRGSYRSLRLERFFKANGMKVEPNADGFFIPADEEEAKELAHFAKVWGMVELQVEDEE